METNILFQIALAILVAAVLAHVAKLLRQPLIVAYIAAGVLVGETQGLGLVHQHEIEPIAELGLILLLYMIGLEIDLRKIKEMGKTMILPGLLQFPLSIAIGLLVAPLLIVNLAGGSYAALYVAAAAALSSTIIVVKLLYDKFELDTVPGRLTLGILVFQDIWAILFIAVQPNLNDPSVLPILLSFAKGAGVVAVALALSRYVLPGLFKSVAKRPELVMLSALAWCFGIALLAEGVGLSLALGALIAGASISTFPYNLDVIAKITSLRDFFVTLFFVTLGMVVPAPELRLLIPAVAIVGFVIASRWIILTPLLNALRFDRRVSFIPALNLSQISEFSLVLCTIGVGLGHITSEVLSVIVFAFVITSVLSTFFITYNYAIYQKLDPVLRVLGIRSVDKAVPEDDDGYQRRILFLGFSRYASSLFYDLVQSTPALEPEIGVVDFNPEVKHRLDERGVRMIYGDIASADTLHHAEVGQAEILVCTLHDYLLKGTTNERLLHELKRIAPKARVIVTAATFHHALHLYHEGAAFVFIPRIMDLELVRTVMMEILEGNHEPMREAAISEIERRELAEILP